MTRLGNMDPSYPRDEFSLEHSFRKQSKEHNKENNNYRYFLNHWWKHQLDKARQRGKCYRTGILSDDTLSLRVGANQAVCTFQKDLPHGHKGVRSHTEVHNNWLLVG